MLVAREILREACHSQSPAHAVLEMTAELLLGLPGAQMAGVAGEWAALAERGVETNVASQATRTAALEREVLALG